MRHNTASSQVGCQDMRAVGRTRRASGSREAPALVAARTRLRQVARDLRSNRKDLAALARELRSAEPAQEGSHHCPDGAELGAQEWAAECADEVANGLDDLAKLAELFARADWSADVTDWIGAASQGDAAAHPRK